MMTDNYNIKIEQNEYTKEDLEINNQFFNSLINHEDNILNKNKNNNKYKFNFVGILAFNSEVIIILPKYLDVVEYNYNDKLEHIKLIIKVFKKLPKSFTYKYKDAFFINDDFSNESVSEIALADFIINDYIHNGLIEKRQKKIKKSHNGSIVWEKTIDEVQPYKSNNNIIYFDTYREHLISNNNELITIIHKFIVDLMIAKYGDLFNIKKRVEKSNEILKKLNALGNTEFLLKLIDKEMQNTYNNRYILVLKAIYNYFSNIRSSSTNNFQLYGTTRFEYLWEEICSKVFVNEFENYSEQIDVPVWKHVDGYKIKSKANKIRPDILKTYSYNHIKYFMILDAKYYSIKFDEGKLENQPNGYDIVKQFVYEMALKEELLNYDEVFNIFIYPKILKGLYKIKGNITLSFFNNKKIFNLYLDPINIIKVYLNNKIFSHELYVSLIDELRSINILL